MQPNVGIEVADREEVAEGLKRFLADSYTLYLKTHNFHWNVTGPQFQTLHMMFEEQYTELWNAVDDIAERIRALGQHAPGSYKAFAKLTSLEETEEVPKADDMVRQLAADHEAVVRTARTVLQPAQEAEDEVTLGLLTDRMTVHEKTAWMLRSLAG